MSRNKAHFLVNVISYGVFVGLASTGFILAYRLPARSCADSLLGFNRHEWGDIHFYLALGFVSMLVFHLFLNWKWVVCTFNLKMARKNPDGSPRGAGGLVSLLILGAVTAALLAGSWLFDVEGESGRRGIGGRGAAGGHEAGGGGQNVRGSMTLTEVAEVEKVDLRRLVAALGLPGDTPGSARLGPLRQRHGFTMETVREAVARLKGSP